MKTIIIFLACCIVNLGVAQIDKAEYFIDTDPGTGAGTPITINFPGFNVSESFSIDTTPLSNGIHTLYVRTREVGKAWSLYYKHTFLVHDFTDLTTPSQIIAAEYFIDADPGTDNGTAIAITPGFSVSESLAISTAALSDGIHTLYIRVKDDDGTWSLYYKHTFLVHTFTAPVQTQINKAEYFFDTDPGVNLGQEITITPGFGINESLGIPTGGLAEGFHTLYVRTRDEAGVWSLYELIEFEVTMPLSTDDKLFLLTKIYPVPANNEITIDTDVSDLESISLFDLQGKKVNSFKVNSPKNTIDVSNLAKGTYILQVKTENGILNKKIIKE